MARACTSRLPAHTSLCPVVDNETKRIACLDSLIDRDMQSFCIGARIKSACHLKSSDSARLQLVASHEPFGGIMRLVATASRYQFTESFEPIGVSPPKCGDCQTLPLYSVHQQPVHECVFHSKVSSGSSFASSKSFTT